MDNYSGGPKERILSKISQKIQLNEIPIEIQVGI